MEDEEGGGLGDFKKQFRGKVFDDHLWAESYSWNPYLFGKHWAAMEATKTSATNYLRKWHTRLWMLTPKFGKESDLWVQLGRESVC
jgi:hypothetical protein